MGEFTAILILLGDGIDGDGRLHLTGAQRLINRRVIIEQVDRHRCKTALLEVFVQFLDLALGITANIGADGLAGEIIDLGDGI